MYFGAHVSASGGIDNAAQRAADIGADAVQVFTQSPRVWRPTNHKPANVDRWFALREEHGIKDAVAHAIYLINIASDDPEMYEEIKDKPLFATLFKWLGSHIGLDHFTVDPTAGQLTFSTFSALEMGAAHVVREIRRRNG